VPSVPVAPSVPTNAPVAAVAVASRLGWRAALALGAAVALPVFVGVVWRVRPTEPERPEQPMAERFQLGPVFELLGRRPIALTVVVAVLCAFAWQATASFLPTFLVEYRGFSATAAGVVFSAYFVVHGLTQPVIGRLSDRYGRDGVLAACMVLAIAGFLLFVGGTGRVAVGAAVLLVGTGMGWSAAALPRFMDHLSDEERGAGFGLVRTTYMVLGSMGSVVTGAVADVLGWAVAFSLLAALLGTVVVVLAVARLR
jgi:predicted MFS family arabinose efflux permease